MPVVVNRVIRGPILAADINAIAALLNAVETTANAAATPAVVDTRIAESEQRASSTYASLDADGDLAINAVKVAASALPYGTPVLARAEYNPGTTTTLSTTSTTSVDVDATNLTVTFTVPDDGVVEVRLEAVTDVQADGTLAIWALRDGGTEVAATVRAATRSAISSRVTTVMRVTGLTPGASKTYTWGHRTSVGTAYARIICGSPYGPAVMTVGKA